MKKSHFDSKEIRKYFLYALGETVLIIIGILIALQIDNWNTDKNREASLKNYLDSIARNIRDDLVDVREIRTSRESAFELSLWGVNFILERASFTADEIDFASYALAEAQNLPFFNANTTGYEALKNSGNLEQFQGRDIEQLLYDYYDTVGRIAHRENIHNEYVQQLSLQVMADWPMGLAHFEFSDPHVLAADRFQDLQPAFRQLLHNPKTNALYTRANSIGPLLLEYEKLEKLGAALVSMIEQDAMQFDAATIAALESIYDHNSGIGHAEMITGGQIALHTFDLGTAASDDSRILGRSVDADPSARHHPFTLGSIMRTDDRLHIDYAGGSEWAAVFFFVRGASATRASLDFSGFDRLQLELKSAANSGEALVHMKDSTDPDDGSQTNIPLKLTDEWQTYEIDLARFENADLSRLHVVLGFLFDEEAQAFSIRNARFVSSGNDP